jgi:peroxiredoxin
MKGESVIELLALSGQDGTHQRELAGRLRLPFPILSDDGLAFAAALRLPTFETGGIAYLRRITLVIANGRIERAVYPVHPPDTHARDLIAMLA